MGTLDFLQIKSLHSIIKETEAQEGSGPCPHLARQLNHTGLATVLAGSTFSSGRSTRKPHGDQRTEAREPGASLCKTQIWGKERLREASNGWRLLDKEGAVMRLTLLESLTLQGASAPEASTPKKGVQCRGGADQPQLSVFWFLGRSWPPQ